MGKALAHTKKTMQSCLTMVVEVTNYEKKKDLRNIETMYSYERKEQPNESQAEQQQSII